MTVADLIRTLRIMSCDYANISPTEKLTAYLRGLSDIPYAAETAELAHAREGFDQLLRGGDLTRDDVTWYAPVLEARAKSIDEMIRRSGVRQVLELAGGLSMRGVALTAIPNLVYVEIDRPEMIAQKAELIAEILSRHHLAPRSNLHLAAANVLDLDRLLAVSARFNPLEPVAVVHEGLLQYLTATETEIVSRHIHALLSKHGGVWITPDFSLKADAENVSAQQRRFRRVIATATERTMYNNAFDDLEHVTTYFGARGFQVEVVSQAYLAPHLVSPERVHLRPGLWEELKPRLRLWVLKCRPEP